jgi:integrase
MSNPERPRDVGTVRRYKTDFRVILEIIGPDKLAKEITRDECRAVRDKVVQLPLRAKSLYPEKSIDEIIEIANRKSLERIAPKTAQSYTTSLSALLGFAEREDYVFKNHAKRLIIHDPVRQEDKREPFSVEQLTTIFNAPIYTGCKDDERGYARPGDNFPRRARFWVPLLALWTGMRLGECCQLHCKDIQEIDGVMCLMIRPSNNVGDDKEEEADRKRVKTDAGIRYVPVHPMLKQIGFLKFSEERKLTGDIRLFPELTLSKQKKILSENFSKWFTRFSTGLGTRTKKHKFHSLRHNYRDALRDAEVPLEISQALGGWSDGKRGEDHRYGKGYKPTTLTKWIAKIDYSGLDLSHLYL